MSALRRTLPADLLHRLLAAGCAALVLALTVFAASPGLHEELHEPDHADSADTCAVALFAGGVSLPVAAVVALPPGHDGLVASVAPARELFLTAPRYLRQPERGPPAS